jgi:short-subunit dehydrogenase
MKTILITGGTSGLGRALAERLSANPHFVVKVIGRDAEKLHQLTSTLTVETLLCDISDTQAVEACMSQISHLDCVINCASLWIQGKLEDNDLETTKHSIEVNLTGTMNICHAATRIMKQAGKGLIININSQNGLYTKAERSAYAAAKWGLTGYTKTLQTELAPFGIRVTGIYPGALETDFIKKSGHIRNKPDLLPLTDIVNAIEFIIQQPDYVVIPELGIKHIAN